MLFIIACIIILIFLIYAGILFSPIFLELLFNLPLIYLSYLFSYDDLFRKKLWYEYGAALLISILIVLFTPSFFAKLPFWQITDILIIALFIAKIGIHANLHQTIFNKIPNKRKTGLKQLKHPYGYLKKIE